MAIRCSRRVLEEIEACKARKHKARPDDVGHRRGHRWFDSEEPSSQIPIREARSEKRGCLICLGFVKDPSCCLSWSHSNADVIWERQRDAEYVATSCPPPPLLSRESLQPQASYDEGGCGGWQWKVIGQGDDSGLELRILACTHTYHKMCLEAWVAKMAGTAAENMCPLCSQRQWQPSLDGSPPLRPPCPTLLHPLQCTEWQLEASDTAGTSAEKAPCCSWHLFAKQAFWRSSAAPTKASDVPAASTSLLWERRQALAAMGGYCAS